ncbi:RDD family protein [Facklamia lactis]|uniref:RDD family protein n=1 Tax=Facklamia lactis TaxID=2749967 RepID=UPI0018CE45DF|nr:RDD family protein [Facklamia lactis]MBG9981240.1 RDD family protein [Facklamia lactis]
MKQEQFDKDQLVELLGGKDPADIEPVHEDIHDQDNEILPEKSPIHEVNSLNDSELIQTKSDQEHTTNTTESETITEETKVSIDTEGTDSSSPSTKASAAGLAPKNLKHKTDAAPSPDDISEKELALKRDQSLNHGYDRLPNEVFAGFWVRLAAYICDWIFVHLLTEIIFGFAGPYINLNLGQWESLAISMARLLIFCLYFTFMTALLKGQTPGKILFRLRTVSLQTEDQKIPFSALLTREFFGRIIFYYAAWIMIILVFTNKHQHPIDMLTDTAVINEKYLDAFAKWQLA